MAAPRAAVPVAFPELHTEAASQEAILLEVASRVEADTAAGGIKHRTE